MLKEKIVSKIDWIFTEQFGAVQQGPQADVVMLLKLVGMLKNYSGVQ